MVIYSPKLIRIYKFLKSCKDYEISKRNSNQSFPLCGIQLSHSLALIETIGVCVCGDKEQCSFLLLKLLFLLLLRLSIRSLPCLLRSCRLLRSSPHCCCCCVLALADSMAAAASSSRCCCYCCPLCPLLCCDFGHTEKNQSERQRM